MSTRPSLEAVRLELAFTSAEISALATRVQALSSQLDAWAESEGFIEQVEWEVVEESAPPFGQSDATEAYPGASQVRPGDSAPPVPQNILDLCSTRLRSASVPVESRVRRAFESGHQAWTALSLSSDYRQAGPVVHLKSTHWIVLRGAGLVEPIRTASRRQAVQALARVDSRAIIEEFPSFVELQVFCLGARIDIPALKQCRNTN